MNVQVDRAAAVFEESPRRLIEWFDEQKAYIKRVLALLSVPPTTINFSVPDMNNLTANWGWELYWREQDIVVYVHTGASVKQGNHYAWPDSKVRVLDRNTPIPFVGWSDAERKDSRGGRLPPAETLAHCLRPALSTRGI